MQRILQPGEIEALDHVSFPRVRLPQPAALFQERAARLAQLADGHPIADYLRFAARLVQAQQRVAAQAPAAQAPSADVIERAGAHGMPLMPASDALPGPWRDTLRALLADLQADAAVPAPLRPVLDSLAAAGDGALDALARQALADNIGREDLAAAPLVMAALQVVFAVRAAAVPEKAVPYTEPATLCPVCGSAPVASVLRIGGNIAGHRYLHCGLCATEWHMVRVKCSHCESTQGVRYQSAEDADGRIGEVVQAETCSQCHTYRKLVSQEKDPYAEPLADDLASLTLDLLMGDTAFSRASGNPLLAIERPLAV
ncbi:formate dehydrogenase accessory protein FdhE [Ottowia sp.]|uniref:formate dehydrogenase accessory protein FdhE n=1 Tax=Ottowia sp. TaxID=1898956 RepID=UPI0025D507D4|nr:formate dehydrogenase accessory protein FdhE [Ottowia sp.]MBK6615593.1 formate dehydrogenase accessory protein FdhE [Ottowia sp.]MBK6746661.1 formate dehydrogenase accessory protein FdhE [Ottowia sp.]